MNISGGVNSLEEVLESLRNDLTVFKIQSSSPGRATRMAEIYKALEMAEKGKFGVCVHCAKEIELARLLEHPSLKECDGCYTSLGV